MERLALISVADKRGVVDLASALVRLGYGIVSTGGTATTIARGGIDVTTVDAVTKYPEMLGGRLKTLHPAIHGGILARRDVPAQLRAIAQLGIAPIDLVVVNLYPFRETIERPDATFEEGIEQIDIGGPAMVRSAAKNHGDVLVVVDPDDYEKLVADLEGGRVTRARRRELAAKAFAHTAEYDTAIAAWLAGEQLVRPEAVAADLPEGCLRIDLVEPETLRYGENPHQGAWRFRDSSSAIVAPPPWRLLQGKELSYNNLIDADAAWALLADLPHDTPTAVVVKHTNPCGVGCVPTSAAGAVMRAFDSDPLSAFGGILAINRPFDLTALRALGDRFLEVLLAPSFEEEVLEALAAKPNLRVVEMGPPRTDDVRLQLRPTVFGVLVQEPDQGGLDLPRTGVVTKAQPTDADWRSLDLLWRICKHVKSNAIVVGDESGTAGVGAGQMSRVDSAMIAIGKTRKGLKATAAASDAFFPFADGIEALAKAGIKAVVQPGGSKRDAEVIAAADAAGMAMVMTGTRHFRH